MYRYCDSSDIDARYYLDQLENNSNSYLTSHTIAVDTQVLDLLNAATQAKL